MLLVGGDLMLKLKMKLQEYISLRPVFLVARLCPWCWLGLSLLLTLALDTAFAEPEQLTQQGTFDTETNDQWAQMLQSKDENIDLAKANWLIASDIPEFHDMTRESYFAQLFAMTEHVREEMDQMQADGYGGTDPNDPKTRCRRFCSAIIGLKFSYAEQFRDENLSAAQSKALYTDPDNVFLAGLMSTRQGSCVSMPLIYLVIGRRLGMPVHLVAIGKHFFIRWEEPGFRMDIETTSVSKIAWTPDDSVYMDIEGMTKDQLRGSDLRNLSNREVIGELFFTRMSHWHAKGEKYGAQSLHDLAKAYELAPDDPVIGKTYQTVFNNKTASEYTSVDHKPKQ